MAISNSKLQDLCRSAGFKFEARAREDIKQVLHHFTDLVPVVRKHTFPDAIERTSLCLQGTIPIVYKNNTYNIPIALYTLDNHPYSGPYCYVTPTEKMQVRVSTMVDSSGKIYLPYLTEWQYPKYDTCGLLQVMTCEFQEKCPVYSVPNVVRPPPPAHPPYPTNSAQTPYPSFSTPYPTNPAGMPTPPYPVTSQPPYPTSQPYPPMYQPYVPNHEMSQSASRLNQPTNPGYSTQTIQPNHIRDSLTSAVDDKLRKRLKELMETPYAELQSIDVNSQELRAGNQKLREMLEAMDKEQKRLDGIKNLYLEKRNELKMALDISRSGSGKSVEESIDDAIDGSSPLQRQILHCYAEDCAIDDTIYALGQALKKGSITLPVYLKCVRQLSRKQFKKRATMQKARTAAGLPI